MDILLINPPQIPLKDFNITTALRMGYPAYPPMGLGYLTSAVKKDGRHHVELYDNHLDGMLKIVNRESDSISTFKECLKNKLRSVKPDVIGLTIMFSVIYDNLIECLACIKEMHPDAVIVIGGAHASMAPESLYNVKEIDYVLSYEAEETLIGFLDYLDGTGSIDDIQALHYRENGNFKANSFLSRETDLDKRQ